ncbi:hypothetical protein GQ54DRAFT_220835 [Martensiomyces pterosporus]|nr:hypothetical protein GQ54DRAFT_220835 [Martensiomyces pterosporus]
MVSKIFTKGGYNDMECLVVPDLREMSVILCVVWWLAIRAHGIVIRKHREGVLRLLAMLLLLLLLLLLLAVIKLLVVVVVGGQLLWQVDMPLVARGMNGKPLRGLGHIELRRRVAIMSDARLGDQRWLGAVSHWRSVGDNESQVWRS